MPNRMSALDASFPHERGPIAVAYRRAGDALEAKVTLPAGLAGTLAWRGQKRDLRPGTQELRIP